MKVCFHQLMRNFFFFLLINLFIYFSIYLDEAPKKKRKVTPRQKVETKKLVSDVLTVEQQQYYEKLTSALRKGSQNVSSVLDDVAHDAGLQPLLVYVLLFVVDEVSANLENIPYLFVLMKLVDALLKNQFLFVEPYVKKKKKK